jgi:arginase
MLPRDIELIGVPANSSGAAGGVGRAPGVLRERGLSALLASRPGFTDSGDLPLPPPQPWRGPSGLLAEEALITMIQRVREVVRAARSGGRFPLLVGGDCPVLLGALAALQDEQVQPGLLFVDGHEDAWPPRASPTGEAADCELGLALRLFDEELDPRLRGLLPRVRPEHVIAVGPPDADELARARVPTLAGRLRALIRPPTSPLVTAKPPCRPEPSFPCPGGCMWTLTCWPSELAAVDYPQPGGLTWAQLTQITCAALKSSGCAGWSVCIYNPDLDPDGSAAETIISYLTQAITTASCR